MRGTYASGGFDYLVVRFCGYAERTLYNTSAAVPTAIDPLSLVPGTVPGGSHTFTHVALLSQPAC